jgi:hypothetical protein
MSAYEDLLENIAAWSRNPIILRGGVVAKDLADYGFEVMMLLDARATKAADAMTDELRSICMDENLPPDLKRRAIEFAKVPYTGGAPFEMAEELEYRAVTLMSRKIPVTRKPNLG